jgi:hypothetical protein
VAAVQATRTVGGAHPLAGEVAGDAARLACLHRPVTCWFAPRGKTRIDRMFRCCAGRWCRCALVQCAAHAGKRRQGFADCQGLDARKCEVDFARGLMAGVMRQPSRPADLAIHVRRSHFEVGSVAALELPIAVRHQAMAWEAGRQEQGRAEKRRAPHALPPYHSTHAYARCESQSFLGRCITVRLRPSRLAA